MNIHYFQNITFNQKDVDPIIIKLAKRPTGISWLRNNNEITPPIMMDLQEFIDEANRIYGNQYNYSNTIFVNNETPITIICNVHGTFTQTPNDHLRLKLGCPNC